MLVGDRSRPGGVEREGPRKGVMEEARRSLVVLERRPPELDLAPRRARLPPAAVELGRALLARADRGAPAGGRAVDDGRLDVRGRGKSVVSALACVCAPVRKSREGGRRTSIGSKSSSSSAASNLAALFMPASWCRPDFPPPPPACEANPTRRPPPARDFASASSSSSLPR